MDGPPCPVHPEVALRRERNETGFCPTCLRHYDLCTVVRYMDMCKLLLDHDGPHQGQHGHMWTMIGGVPVDTEAHEAHDALVKRFLFPVIRRDFGPKPHPELLEDFDKGEPIPGTKCMEVGCHDERWKHPKVGALVLCMECAYLVAVGMRRAPPLRRNIDYYSGARKTFLVEDLPEEKK